MRTGIRSVLHNSHFVMFLVKEKSAVYECVESYLAHYFVDLRARNEILKQRTEVMTFF